MSACVRSMAIADDGSSPKCSLAALATRLTEQAARYNASPDNEESAWFFYERAVARDLAASGWTRFAYEQAVRRVLGGRAVDTFCGLVIPWSGMDALNGSFDAGRVRRAGHAWCAAPGAGEWE